MCVFFFKHILEFRLKKLDFLSYAEISLLREDLCVGYQKKKKKRRETLRTPERGVCVYFYYLHVVCVCFYVCVSVCVCFCEL